MSKNITLDPITEKEFREAVAQAYNEVMDDLDEEALEEMDLNDALFMLFLNGFYRGAVAMTDNAELKETFYMITKEIDYQERHSN